MQHKTSLEARSSSLTSRWFWIVCSIFILWTSIDYIKDYSLVILGKTESFDLVKVSLYILPIRIIGVLLAPLTFWVYSRYKDSDLNRVWKHFFLFSILVGLLFGFLYHSFWLMHAYLFNTLENEPTGLASLFKYYKFIIPSSFTGVVYFWALAILFFALDFYDQFKSQSYRSLQLEAQLNDSKLRNLRMQLNPHFLFNALNTVSMMVRKDNKSKAINMISAVSDLLRTSLNSSNDHFITLKEEIDLLRKYIQIEEQRFSDRLMVEYDIDDDLWDVNIPNLLLQPLVENAFKYGLAKNINDAYIKISAKRSNQNIRIEIYNKGNLLKEFFNEGIGLQNTKSRLAMSYSTINFTLANADDLSGVVARIEIPLKDD